MKNVIEAILKRHGKLEAFKSKWEFHFRIENEPFMPLVIERHGEMVTVTHYFEQNGDLVPDPDMEFKIHSVERWIPISIQHSSGHYFTIYKDGDDEEIIDQKVLHDLEVFSKMWGRNLLEQGYITC